MAMDAPKSLRLRCSVQCYDWGRSGVESIVARLYSRNAAADVDPDRPYAEFWMGTHDSGPSLVLSDSPDAEPLALKSWIRGHPAVLGAKVIETWGSDLPFLFKVLSVAKALSIQAHPDKQLAEELHKAYPSIYRDSNHKPEMGIALTDFKALCGFVSIKELKDVIASVPEIIQLVGSEDESKIMHVTEQNDSEEAKSALQSIFTRLMSANKRDVSEMVSKLKKRLDLESKVRILTEKEELVLLLEKQYPADIGVISAFFFNYVKLKPGEALYLGPNEPHAYISGECIECMATSDNVVRAGLTPKYRDVQTLCSMLTYKQGFPEILQGVALNPYISRYRSPFDEFEVDRCILPAGKSVVFAGAPGPSIVVVIAGEGSMQVVPVVGEETIMEGDVLFGPAQTEMRLTADAHGSLLLYRAGVNSMFYGNSF